MEYEKINPDTWPRGEIFRYYMRDARLVMSLTVDVDVTVLRSYIRAKGMKFYPAMIWAVSRAVNAQEAFRYALNDSGELILWHTVSPYYAHFHPEDEQFTRICTPYTEDLKAFHARFLRDRERFDDKRGFEIEAPPNVFDVSCLPWVRYRHFDVQVFDDGKFLAPTVVWGKYEEENGKWILPMTMRIHHAVADGFHLARFFADVQHYINNPED